MHMITSMILAVLLTQATPTPPSTPTPPPPASTPGSVPTPPPAAPQAPAVEQAQPPASNQYINWSKGTILEATLRIGIYSDAVQHPGKPLLFPVLNDSGSSIVDLESINAQVTMNGSMIDQGSGVDILNSKDADRGHLIEAPAPSFPSSSRVQGNRIQMGFQINQTIACWSPSVDETAMASIPWPATWPDEAASALTVL